MKANELKVTDLMVGNWVICYHPSRLKSFEKVSVGLLQTMKEQVYGHIKEDSPLFRIVEPIPLTKEILEKNADSHFDERVYDIYCFHNEDDDGYDHLVEITFIYGRFEWTINGNEYSIEEIKYVHELQHALRLCKVDKEIVL